MQLAEGVIVIIVFLLFLSLQGVQVWKGTSIQRMLQSFGSAKIPCPQHNTTDDTDCNSFTGYKTKYH